MPMYASYISDYRIHTVLRIIVAIVTTCNQVFPFCSMYSKVMSNVLVEQLKYVAMINQSINLLVQENSKLFLKKYIKIIHFTLQCMIKPDKIQCSPAHHSMQYNFRHS